MDTLDFGVFFTFWSFWAQTCMDLFLLRVGLHTSDILESEDSDIDG